MAEPALLHKDRIGRIEAVLATLIAWLHRELGSENARLLLEELMVKPPDRNG